MGLDAVDEPVLAKFFSVAIDRFSDAVAERHKHVVRLKSDCLFLERRLIEHAEDQAAMPEASFSSAPYQHWWVVSGVAIPAQGGSKHLLMQQNQALSALLFLYRHVIGREVGDLGEVIRARKPTRLPVVMTREEVKAVLANLTGDK